MTFSKEVFHRRFSHLFSKRGEKSTERGKKRKEIKKKSEVSKEKALTQCQTPSLETLLLLQQFLASILLTWPFHRLKNCWKHHLEMAKLLQLAFLHCPFLFPAWICHSLLALSPSLAGAFYVFILPGKWLQSGLLVEVDPFQPAAGWFCPSCMATRSHMAVRSGTQVSTQQLSMGWLPDSPQPHGFWLAPSIDTTSLHLSAKMCWDTFGLLRVRQLPLKLAASSCVLSRSMLLGRAEESLHYAHGISTIPAMENKELENIEQILIQILGLKKISWHLIAVIKCDHHNHKTRSNILNSC